MTRRPPNGEVAFYLGRDHHMPWSPRDVDVRGLGGTQTALVRVAAGLVEHGYRVTVYANVTAEEEIDGVAYRRRARFDATKPRTAVVGDRAPELFDERPRAAKTILWVHDVHEGEALTAGRAERIDHIVGLSAWHLRTLRARHPFAADNVVRIGHGFDAHYFTGHAARQQRVVSTCQPARGVDVLLELWPAVRARVLDAELVCCHAPGYDYIDARNPRSAAHRERVRALARQPGVRLQGPLSRPELANLMLRSRVWAHPSWHTPSASRFHETFCISALEAQGAGLCVAASAWGALPETVRVGGLVNGGDDPGAGWRAAMVEQIVLGLTDREAQDHAATAGPAAVRDQTWGRAARGFAELIAAPGRAD